MDCGECPSWRHDGPTAVLPGHRTCGLHLDEEPHIVRVEHDLECLATQVREYEAAPSKHPDEAKAFLEAAVGWFFDQDLVPAGFRTIGGFRGSEELDLIVTLDAGDHRDWNARLTVRRRLESATIALHVEVAYRSSRDYRKVRDNVDKLNATIDQSIRQGHGLPWTGLVLLGPGWDGAEATVMQVVHTAYHSRTTERISLAGSEWWPLIDAVVMPGLLYKKHDLFESIAMAGIKHPVMMPSPCAPDPLRPLALARGFVVHRLQVLRGLATAEGEAWPDTHTAALSGPISEIIQAHPPATLRAILIGCHHADAPGLWHMGSAYPEPICVPIPFEFEDKTCVSGGRYSMRMLPPVTSHARPTSEVRRRP